MDKGQRTAFIITFTVLLPLTVSLFWIKNAGLTSLFLYFKTFLSAGFVFCALITVYIRKTFDRLSLFCLSALVFGMLGDIFLAAAGKIQGIGYIAGAVMFLFQHIMICTGLLSDSRSRNKRPKLLITMTVTAAVVCLFVFVFINAAGVALGGLTVPSAVYAVILAWTAVIPFVLREKNEARMPLMGIAGILFFAADVLLICGFIENAPKELSISNLIPYYYAQYLIAFSTGQKAKRVKDKLKVTYNGIECLLFENYPIKGSGPCVKLIHAKDIEKAYGYGFDCVGHPDEIVKYLTEDEYKSLLRADDQHD